MHSVPEEILTGWAQKQGPLILTTVDGEGVPNSIYATCVGMTPDGRIIVADNYFNKTKANIVQGCKVSILFITEEGKSYQVKGTVAYHTEGELYDFMKSWNPSKHPGHAAAVVTGLEFYSGGSRILS